MKSSTTLEAVGAIVVVGFLAVAGIALVAGVVYLQALFWQLAWNSLAVPMFQAPPATLLQGFIFSAVLSIVGGAFKATSSSKNS